MNIQTELNVAKKWFKILGVVSLWYIAISAVCWPLVSLLLAWLEEGEIIFTLPHLMTSTCTFIFVIGIVMPLIYTKYFLSLGVTRKQLARGMMIALAAISLAGAFLLAMISVVQQLAMSASFDLLNLFLSIALSFTLLFAFFLVGWVIAIGFGYGRIITAAPTILFAIVCFQGLNLVSSVPLFGTTLMEPLINPLLGLVLAVVCTIAIAYFTTRIIHRLPIKAN